MENNRPENGKIRLLVAESQRIILNALVTLIESFREVEIMGTATDGQELLRQLDTAKPDIILLDLRKPGPSGIEVTRIVDERVPWVKVISLSSHTHPVYIREMLKHGAKGFLSKDCTVEELREGIQKVYQGKTFFCNQCAGVMLKDYAGGSGTEGLELRNITPREIEIIGYIAEGSTTREIAEKLFISSKTVERHKANLLKKMNLKNTAHLVRVAAENGLLIL